jgi:hypothetical protein
MVTDPPYGVGVDHSWRDGLRQPAGSARTARLLNDDRADWSAAYRLTEARVAYVWHGALYAGLVHDGLLSTGLVPRQQIIWLKQIHALSRSAYQWAHEPCWYAVRKGAGAGWQGGRKQTTVWEAASPIAGFGSGGAAEHLSGLDLTNFDEWTLIEEWNAEQRPAVVEALVKAAPATSGRAKKPKRRKQS